MNTFTIQHQSKEMYYNTE